MLQAAGPQIEIRYSDCSVQLAVLIDLEGFPGPSWRRDASAQFALQSPVHPPQREGPGLLETFLRFRELLIPQSGGQLIRSLYGSGSGCDTSDGIDGGSHSGFPR